MLKKYSLRALQLAINNACKLDEHMPAKIQALDGKVLKMIITPLDVDFFILFKQQQIHLETEYSEHPDTIIHSSPIGLIRLSLLPASKARSLFNDKIRMSGDIELGQKIKKLFDEMEIDWEGHLAHFTGDVVAHQIGSMVRKGISFKKQFTESMRHSLSEFLQEEIQVFPTRAELEDFYQDIDELSLSVERLHAQVKQMVSAHETD